MVVSQSTIDRLKNEIKEFWENMNMEMETEEIDNTIAEITEVLNEAYEHLLHELFTFGDYMYDLSLEYQDVDGRTVKMSWQDRDKRIEWLHP